MSDLEFDGRDKNAPIRVGISRTVSWETAATSATLTSADRFRDSSRSCRYAPEVAIGVGTPGEAIRLVRVRRVRTLDLDVLQSRLRAPHPACIVRGLFSRCCSGFTRTTCNRWRLWMYIDVVDWVSLPNVLDMSQYGDCGVGSKPYCASGNYVNRISDYCKGCRYRPAKVTGDDACPFTTLYWNFPSRNRKRLEGNRYMGFQFKNLDRNERGERRAIKKCANELKTRFPWRMYL